MYKSMVKLSHPNLCTLIIDLQSTQSCADEVQGTKDSTGNENLDLVDK